MSETPKLRINVQLHFAPWFMCAVIQWQDSVLLKYKHDRFQSAFGGVQRHYALLPAPSYMLPRLGKAFIKKHIVKSYKTKYSHKNQTDAAHN